MTTDEIHIFRLIQLSHFLLAYIEHFERGADANAERLVMLRTVAEELDEIEDGVRAAAKGKPK